MFLIIAGAGGSGKDTLAKHLEQYEDFEKIVQYTTRPIREGEKDGKDYHFVDDKTFDDLKENGEFVEFSSFRGWNYGTVLDLQDFPQDKSTVAVFNPTGVRLFEKRFREETELEREEYCIVYLDVDRRTRLINSLQRGDDIEEAYRRSVSDEGAFNGFENEADIVLNNHGFSKSLGELCDELFVELSKRMLINPDKNVLNLEEK